MARRSRILGDFKLRRLLRNIHKTLDNELATALGNIEAIKGRTLGVVLNRIRKGSNNKYLYDSYYGQDTAPKRSKAARDKPIKPVKVSGGKRSK